MTERARVKKRKKCPACGEVAVVPVVYGLPGPSLMQQAEAGEVVLGGCCLPGDGRYHCGSCDWRGYSLTETKSAASDLSGMLGTWQIRHRGTDFIYAHDKLVQHDDGLLVIWRPLGDGEWEANNEALRLLLGDEGSVERLIEDDPRG